VVGDVWRSVRAQCSHHFGADCSVNISRLDKQDLFVSLDFWIEIAYMHQQPS